MGGGALTHRKVTGMCGQDPRVGSFGDRLNKEKMESFSEDKRKIGGSFGEDYKKEDGLSVKPSFFRKKGGHLVRLSILVQNLATI